MTKRLLTYPLSLRSAWGAGQVQTTNRIDRNHRWWALTVLLQMQFVSALMATIVSTATPSMVADLHGFDLYGWVFTSYMLSSTVSVPIAGKVSDLYGRRPLYLIALAAFTIGNALCVAAPTMVALIGARIAAGLGGGALLALTGATIADVFAPRERGRWMGVILSAYGLGSIVGPIVGGLITDHVGWRWVFAVPLPILAFAFLVVGCMFPRVRASRRIRLDLVGSALVSGGLVGVLLGFTWGGAMFSWDSWQVELCLTAGAALLALFVVWELHSDEPVLDPRLFRVPVYSIGLCFMFVLSGLYFMSIGFLPLFVQAVEGKTATSSGFILVPMIVAFMAGSAVGGSLISRSGRYKLQALVTSALMLAGVVLFATLSRSPDSHRITAGMVLFGFGAGATFPMAQVTVQSAFPHHVIGAVNAGRQMMGQLGAVVAVSLMSAVLVGTFDRDLPLYAPRSADRTGLSPQTLLTAASQARIRRQFPAARDGAETYRRFVAAIRHALANALGEVFLIGAGLAVALVLLALVYPRIELATWDAPGE
jgi:EmrB/QacA subfamily drug resistance transporter